MHTYRPIHTYIELKTSWVYLQMEKLKVSNRSLTSTPEPTSVTQNEHIARLESEHATQINNMQSRITVLDTELSTTSNALSQSKAECGRLSGEVDGLRSELSAQTSKVTELETTVKEKEVEGEDLLLLLETNSEKISNMKGKLRKLGQQVSDSEEEDDDDEAD